MSGPTLPLPRPPPMRPPSPASRSDNKGWWSPTDRPLAVFELGLMAVVVVTVVDVVALNVVVEDAEFVAAGVVADAW